MDSASVTVGVVGLEGLFSACMECFDYIQLGRAFGRDYGECILRLDAAKLRLSRWGEATGIAGTSQASNRFVVSMKDFRLAESLLLQIQESFERTQRISRRYQEHDVLYGPPGDPLTVCVEQTDLSPQDLQLHSQLQAIASRRQKSKGPIQKAPWALYEKKMLDTLIGEITEFTDKLAELSPDFEESQMLLCESELYTIGNAQALTRLNAIAGADDKVLHDCVEAGFDRRSHAVSNWKALEEADVWVGDENGPGVESIGHRVSKFLVSGTAKVRVGNDNIGRES